MLYWEEEARETAIHKVLGTSVEEEARLGEAELAAILTISFGQWNQVADRYQAVWSRYSKEEFARLAPKLPDVNP